MYFPSSGISSTIFEGQPLIDVVRPDADNDAWQPSGPQIRPWLRYWARMFDNYLFAICSVLLIGCIAILLEIFGVQLERFNWLDSRIFEILSGLIFLFAYVFVEPIFLSTWGTTPGKALFKIRVRQPNGDKLSYRAALSRSFNVWAKGLACGIGLFQLFTFWNAYNHLKTYNVTIWDYGSRYKVSHQTLGPIRVVIILLLFIGVPVGFVGLIVLGSQS